MNNETESSTNLNISYKDFVKNGVLYSYREDNSHAIECFSEAIRICPDRFEGYLQRGLCFYNCGLIIDALKDFDDALNLDLEPGDRHLFQGLKWEIGKRDFKNAEFEYLSAVACNDDCYYGHYFMGFIERERGFLEKSLDRFKRAYEISNPYNNSLVLYHISRCYIRMIFGNTSITEEKKKEYEKEAEGCLLKSLEINPNCVRSIIEYGDFLVDFRGKTDEGIAYYEKVLALDKRYISAFDRISEALCVKGDKRNEEDNNKLEDCIKTMKRLDPTFSSSYTMKSYLLSKSEDCNYTDRCLEILDCGLLKCFNVRFVRSLKRAKRLILEFSIRDRKYENKRDKCRYEDTLAKIEMDILMGNFDSFYKTRMKELMKKLSRLRIFTDICILCFHEDDE